MRHDRSQRARSPTYARRSAGLGRRSDGSTTIDSRGVTFAGGLPTVTCLALNAFDRTNPEAQGGRTDATTWSTVQDRVGVVDDLLSWAILGLDRVANKLEGVDRAGERAKLAKSVEEEVAEFLAVAAHCFGLQDALDVMRLDRVLEDSPDLLDDQRRALESHRQQRRRDIMEATEGLVARIDRAAGAANSHVVLHPDAARAVSCSANNVGHAVAKLHAPLGIESDRLEVAAPGWWGAVRDGQQLQNAGKEAGPKMVVPALFVGAVVLYAVPTIRPLAKKALEAAKSRLLQA